jgi:hypothetical protein
MPVLLRRVALLLALMPIVVGAVHLMRARNSFQRDYHWTPLTARLPYDAGAKNFQVYVRDHRLDETLQAGRLGVKTDEGWAQLAPGDVSIRLNHLDRVTREPLLVGIGLIAAALGWIAGLLFAQLVARQEKKILAP